MYENLTIGLFVSNIVVRCFATGILHGARCHLETSKQWPHICQGTLCLSYILHGTQQGTLCKAKGLESTVLDHWWQLVVVPNEHHTFQPLRATSKVTACCKKSPVTWSHDMLSSNETKPRHFSFTRSLPAYRCRLASSEDNDRAATKTHAAATRVLHTGMPVG